MSCSILILGAKGLIGTHLVNKLRNEKYQVYAYNKQELDIRDMTKIFEAFVTIKPKFIINTAAYLNADKCEENYIESYLTNVKGVINLVTALKKALNNKGILIHFSSDFVFDGKKGNYSELDIPNPINVYGIHKWLADEIIINSGIQYYILRIASVIGWHHEKSNFLKVILKKALLEKQIKIVSNICISCATTEFIGDIVVKIIKELPEVGLYNVVAKGKTSWFNIAQLAFNFFKIDYPIIPIKAEEFPFKARRPLDSSLIIKKLENTFGKQKNWQEAIIEHLELNQNFYKNFCLSK